jgi:predicted AlkP superfamily pyrophosphatase or phosphodiesterase
MLFSYPGYNEILTGAADDERITSNDKVDNPNLTVLETLNRDKRYAGKVAAFASWDVFDNIINSNRSGIPVSAGLMKQTEAPNEREKLINELMFEIPNPLGDVRLDAFTFHYAFEYLKREKPKVLYIAFDETDDFAHHGNYDLYLEAAHYTDAMMEKLWNWVQSDPLYKDNTTLIITSDHGRGHSDIDSWRSHGIKIIDADQIWLAVIGPDTPALGELKKEGQLYQNQVAATIAYLMNINLEANEKTGAMIKNAVGMK